MLACYKIEWLQTAEVLSVVSTESHGPESLAPFSYIFWNVNV